MCKWVYVCIKKDGTVEGCKTKIIKFHHKEIEERFESILQVCQQIIDLKTIADTDSVQKANSKTSCNTDACFQYGKCPFWNFCPRVDAVVPSVENIFPEKETVKFCYKPKRVVL